MITEKVLGAYTIVGTLSPTEQADWYRKAVEEWNIKTFEVPILAGVPLVPEIVDVFTELSASLVVNALWRSGRQLVKRIQHTDCLHWTKRLVKQRLVDACSSLQQCMRRYLRVVFVSVMFSSTPGDAPEKPSRTPSHSIGV